MDTEGFLGWVGCDLLRKSGAQDHVRLGNRGNLYLCLLPLNCIEG